MKLFTKAQQKKLLANGKASLIANEKNELFNPFPVIRLFTPDAKATWLISEIDPDNPDIAFGLCDLGLGFPELGYVAISDLSKLRGQLGLPVERDRHWTPGMRLIEYSDEASDLGCIGR